MTTPPRRQEDEHFALFLVASSLSVPERSEWTEVAREAYPLGICSVLGAGLLTCAVIAADTHNILLMRYEASTGLPSHGSAWAVWAESR